MNINEKRKQLAIEKQLIMGEDCTIYNKVLKIYKCAFEEFLNYYLKFQEIDQILEASNLYFNPLQKKISFYEESNLKSKYFFCLNYFYIEKLSLEDIKILKNATSINMETINIIKNTFKEIIIKDNVKNITYGYATPETIIANGTIVLKFVIGKTNINDNNLFIENRKKQQIFVKKLISQMENQLMEKLSIPVKILFTKEM